jgi:hypothetical protein
MTPEQKIAKLRLLASEWSPKAPAALNLNQWPPRAVLQRAELLYVVGVADGAPFQKLVSWLEENRQRRLVFLEDDGPTIAALLERDHPLLYHPRVDLEWLPPRNRNAVLAELAERFPVSQIEIIALPGKTVRAIRLPLLKKTALSQALYLDRMYGYQHFENFLRNIPRLRGAFYANGLTGSLAGVPAVVVGAGPSLEAALPLLRTLENKAVLIAGGSAIAALSAAGIEPHFGIAIDPNLEEYRRFKNNFAWDCPLLFSTRLFPDVFNTCSGPFGYLRSGIGGAPELWIEEELGLSDPLLGAELPDETISVTPICLAFADLLGCNPILLAGIDLAYTNGHRYAANIAPEQETISSATLPDKILWRKDKRGQRVATAIRWVVEAAGIAAYAARRRDRTFIDTTVGGLPLRNLPFLPLQEAVDRHCTHSFDLRGRIAQQIALHPMPDPTSKIDALRQSLARVVEHLEVMTGERKGAKPLAEYEIGQELAASILFYDIGKLCAFLEPQEKWPFYLRLARSYLSRYGAEGSPNAS